MTQVLKRMNRGDITVHGFRSHLPRLGQRDNELSEPRRRDGAGARHRRQGGSRLSARRFVGETPTARRGVVEILHVAATGWRGAADAQASMKPEDLKPEERRLRELAALKVLWELLDAAKKQGRRRSWRARGWSRGRGFSARARNRRAASLAGKWEDLKATVAANRPAPGLLDQNARRLAVLMVESGHAPGLARGPRASGQPRRCKACFRGRPRERSSTGKAQLFAQLGR